MRCPSCAAEILDGSRFCGLCGAQVPAHAPHAPAPAAHHSSYPAIASRQARGQSPHAHSRRHPSRPVDNDAGYHQAIRGSDRNLGKTRQAAPNLAAHPSAPDLGAPRQVAMPPASEMAPTLQSTPALQVAPRLPSDPGPPRTIMSDAVSPPELNLGANARASASAPAAQAPDSLQIPVSRGARFARIGAVLALDAVLIALGVVFLLSYLDARDAAAKNGAVEGKAEQSASADTERAQRRVVESAVAELVDTHRGDIQRCYRQAAENQAAGTTLEGRLDIDLVIDETGALKNAKARVNETGSDELAACVCELFESWSLAQPPERPPVQLTWPLRFKAPE